MSKAKTRRQQRARAAFVATIPAHAERNHREASQDVTVIEGTETSDEIDARLGPIGFEK